MEPFSSAVDLLATGGPWAIVVFLGFAYWQKDRQYRELMQQLIGLVEKNVSASGDVKNALDRLHDLISAMLQQR